MEESLLPVSSLDCRSDAVTANGSLYHKAAAFVDLAEDGVGLPEEILEGSNFEKAAPLYFIFNYVHLIGKFNSILLLILNFFEKPLWCFKHLAESCNNRDYYFLGELPYLTATQSIIYEGVTLVILVIHTLFPISFEGFHVYWKRNLNRLKVILLLILVADVVVYFYFLTNSNYLPFRIAPYLRVLFFILNNRELRENFLILAGMFGAYLNVVALTALYILFSSWLGYVFFTDTRMGETTFTSYGRTLYQMCLLFTVSNHPDVWIPAYKDSRWYCLFFILYVIVSIYVVINLILAGIYGSFISELKKQVAEKDQTKLRILKKTFSLIDNNNTGFIYKEQCFLLFKELNKYRTIPEIPKDDFELIFNELDVSGDCKINLDEFNRLCDLIALKFEEEDSLSIFEKYPNFYHSRASKKLRGFVQSAKFENIIVFILLVNLVAVIVETTLDMQNNSAQNFWEKVEVAFGWLYVIEMALKVYTYGFGNYWRDGKNQFDFCITCFIVIEEMTTFLDLDGLNFMFNRDWIRYLLIARMLRFIRFLTHIEQSRAFVSTFLSLMYSLLPYFGTIFCILCIYCSLGLQEIAFENFLELSMNPLYFLTLSLKVICFSVILPLAAEHSESDIIQKTHIFGGIVNTGNPNLNQTDLAGYDYLLFNFNDYPNGMVTLFNLLLMGLWPPVMQSYKELTGTSWTYGYFFSFYLIVVLWLLNLVVVFVLVAFRVENEDPEASARPMEDADKEERRERRQTVGSKNRRQKLDDLHHRMCRD